MIIARSPQELSSQHDSVSIAIGFFDGVHLGHKSIVESLLKSAIDTKSASVIVTFHNHPRAVLAPDQVPPLIYPFQKKVEFLAQLGVDGILLLDFDKRLSQLGPDDFIQYLHRDPAFIKSITVGSNFTFGRQRSGNLETLRKMAATESFLVQGVDPVTASDSVISSTRIRNAIQSGRFEEASNCLGRTYRLCGTIVRGDGVGRKLGFPTANLNTEGLVTPPTGVYQVRCRWGAGKEAIGAMNIGYRPTLNNPAPVYQTEVHLLDIDQELYDSEMQVEFIAKIRDEKKFSSVEELKHQITADVQSIRAGNVNSPR